MSADAEQSPEQKLLIALQNAPSCPPVTDEELRGAFSFGESAPRHLATLVVLHSTRLGPGIEGYLTHSRAEAALKALSGEQGVFQPTREALRARHEKIISDNAAAAAGYAAILSLVDRQIGEFDQRYRDGDKINRAALGELYDETDELDHPALSALPRATAFGEGSSARDAVVDADRYVRFIVLQAMAAEETPPEVVAQLPAEVDNLPKAA